MKIFKSIKWRLQLWYGVILFIVLFALGFTAFQLENNRLFGRVDQELHRRVNLLANAVHHLPRGQQPDFFRPSPDRLPDEMPPRFQNDRPAHEFRLPSEFLQLFGTNSQNDFYFRISMLVENDRHEIARSENYRELKEPEALAQFDHFFDPLNHVEQPIRKGPPDKPKFINYHEDRITADLLPSGEMIEVGCSIAPEKAELRQAALSLATIGGLILLVGFVGGWWLVGRSLKPISEISSTAVKISAGDLAQRINVAETESELGQLAAVLNSTFARLETAFAQQQQFAADAAHELRTPVTVILTQTQMALARERDAAGYRQTVEACQRAAQRMRRLIESLLELARFDAGQEVLKRMRFDLARTVADSAELVQTLAEERGVKIISKIEPLEIIGDAERLAQVVTNLLTNGIQYNRPAGEVRLELHLENGLAVLKIADTGQGIAPEDLPRVFERFYRGDKSRTGGGSAGLGLSICKAIIEAHGGTIEVTSEAGVGTTFTVRLPV
jgi:two-component system, OmpR family, sensor kinase